MIKLVFIIAGLMILPHPAAAQMDPTKAFPDSRRDYLEQVERSEARMDGEREAHRDHTNAQPDIWFEDWMSRQPYEASRPAGQPSAPARPAVDRPQAPARTPMHDSGQPIAPLPLDRMLQDNFEGVQP